MLDIAEGLGADGLVLAPISGDGSALMSLPPAGIAPSDAAALSRALLASGAPIDAMNSIRRHLSRINGGRLAAAAHPARLLALMIADVPGDDPMNIASGPSVGDPTMLEDARALVRRFDLDLPPAVRAALEDPANESVKPGDPRLARAGRGSGRADLGRRNHRDPAPRRARARAGRAQCGVSSRAGAGARWRAGDLCPCLRHRRRGRRRPGWPARVPARSSRPTRWRAGRDAFERALARFDGHGLFAALGDQVVTGPTLTNVNDFRAVLVIL